MPIVIPLPPLHLPLPLPGLPLLLLLLFFLLGLFLPHLRRLHVLIPGPPRVRAQPAQLAVRAEAAQVVEANLPLCVLLIAPGPQRAKPPIVVRAGREAGRRVDVEVQALVAVGAVPVADEKVALWHLAQVVLVQELARLSLLAEAAEPVLAHQRAEGGLLVLMAATAGLLLLLLRGVGYVPLGAVGFQGAARGRVEGFAYWSVGGEGVLVGFLEERGECE